MRLSNRQLYIYGGMILFLIVFVISPLALVRLYFGEQVSDYIKVKSAQAETYTVPIKYNEPFRFSYQVNKVKFSDQGLSMVNYNDKTEVILLDKVEIRADSQLAGFIEDAYIPGRTEIKYQITTDQKTWNYYNGQFWQPAGECTACGNTAKEINAHISELPVKLGALQVKALMRSDVINVPRINSVHFVVAGERTYLEKAHEEIRLQYAALAKKDGDASDDLSAPSQICGNGIVEGDEQCDDGNNNQNDFCSNQCHNRTPICHATSSQSNPFNFLWVDDSAIDGEGANDHTHHPNDIIPIWDINNDGVIDENDCNATLLVCGNGVIENGEECDDGNLTDGDGCSAQCTVEIMEPVCGNNALENGEECDDGNLTDGDGCSAQCTIESMEPVCGNGAIENGEECDDGNLSDGDGCSAQCLSEVPPACGNSILEQGEECDDGNLSDGDGCSAQCLIEIPAPVCGNGAIENGEECDDGNLADGDGCSAQCTIETTGPVCGDGNLDAGEQCDDGNLSDGDGCSSQCLFEEADCGNGIVEDDEQCDDGNNDQNDFCNNQCENQTPICHATGSQQHPYNMLWVDDSAIDGEGENDHSNHPNDIIPIWDVNQDGLINEDDCNSYQPGPPVAEDDSASTTENTPVVIHILDNDHDPDNDLDVTSVTIITPPASGDLFLDTATGVVTYTPHAGFVNASDSFVYQVCDLSIPPLCDTATVTIAVSALLVPPIAVDDNAQTLMNTPVVVDVVDNDYDLDGTGEVDPTTVTIITAPINGGSVSVDPVTGEVTYTPPTAEYYGPDSFEYEVCDYDSLCARAWVYIRVLTPPIANDDTEATDVNTAVEIPVLDNDYDPDGVLVPGTLEIITPPAHGSAIIDTVNNTVIYEPNENYQGADSFVYRIYDDDGLYDDALVTIGINTEMPPVANDDNASTTPSRSVVIDILNNDDDANDNLDPACVEIVSNPAHGSISVDPQTGEVTYTPDGNFIGVDTFQYTVCDLTDLVSNVATVNVTIRSGGGGGGGGGPTPPPPETPEPPVLPPPPAVAPLVPPEAIDDFATTPESTSVTIPVLDNDFDPDGSLNPGSVSIISMPVGGTVEVNADGTITYTPFSSIESDSFSYLVCDDDGLCDQAYVYISIPIVFAPPPLVVPVAVLPPAPILPIVIPPEPEVPGPLIFAGQEITVGNQVVPLEGDVVQVNLGGEYEINVEAIGATTAAVTDMETGEVYNLSYDEELKIWNGSILPTTSSPPHQLKLEMCNDRECYSRDISRSLVIVPGQIMDQQGQPISGAVITAYMQDPTDFMFKKWNGQTTAQANPVVTAQNGQFSFILPRGKFYLEITADGYEAMVSKIENLTYDKAVATANVKMKPKHNLFYKIMTLSFANKHLRTFPLLVAAFPAQADNLTLGQPAPNIKFIRRDGTRFNLKDQPGPIVVAAFNTWSNLSQEQMNNYARLVQTLSQGSLTEPGQKIAVFSVIGTEPWNVGEGFLRRGGYDIQLLKTWDRFYEDYQLITAPQLFIIDENYRLIGNIVGSHSYENLLMQTKQILEAGQ